MKIAHITPVYPPYKGGIGHVAFDYVEYLKKIEEVSVFTPQYDDFVFSSDVVALKGFTYGKASLVPQLLWELKFFDIIHLHYPFYGGALFTALAALIWKKRLVVTYHMKTQGTGWLGLVFRWHRRLVEPLILIIADTVLVSSLDYAESIGLKHKQLVAMPFGVDTKRFRPGGREQIREKIGLSLNDFIFLFVGGLDDAHYFKGVDVLLAAAAKLRNTKNWRLVIVGGGDRQYNLERMANELGIVNFVYFVGRVSDEDLPSYFRVADVHVLPSIDQSEAYGLVTLEAAASGLPSFVSALPGVRTLVRHKETGLHIPIGDVRGVSLALAWGLNHEDKCRELGKNALKRARDKYDKNTCLGRLHDLYKEGKVS